MPVLTWSAHWLAHPQFSKAVAEHLNHEGESIVGHVKELLMHQPFKPSIETHN
jgi:predicted N-acyltransferase